MHSSDVGDAAKQAVQRSRSLLSDQLDQRSTQIGQTVSSTADDLRRVGDQLRQSGTIGGAADLADRGAELIERVGSYLQNSDGDALIADAEAYARERPWVVATAALAVGFAASRVLKASSSRRYRATTAGRVPALRDETTYGGGSFGDATSAGGSSTYGTRSSGSAGSYAT